MTVIRTAGRAPSAADGAARRGFERPTALEALQELARATDPATALQAWNGASMRTGLHGFDLDVEQQFQLLDALEAALDALAGRVAVRSHRIRLRTWTVLAGTEVGDAPDPRR